MLTLLVNVIRLNRPFLVRVHPEDWGGVDDELKERAMWWDSPVAYRGSHFAHVLGVPVRLDAGVARGSVTWDR